MQLKLFLTTFAILALYANGSLAATTTTKAATTKATSAAPAATTAATGNCVGGCVENIPAPASNGLPANSLELYYLGWNNAYIAGEAINFNFWITNNPTSTGQLPGAVNIHLYDEFGLTKIADIAQQVSVPKTNGSTPFALSQWTVPAVISANFNTSNTYMITFEGPDGWRRDRRLALDGVTAQPGGGPNPAYANAVTAPVVVYPNGTVAGAQGKSQDSSAPSDLPSQLFYMCLLAVVVAQLVVFAMF